VNENIDLEKLIIQTSIIFVSIFSVIGLTLGGIIKEYKFAYISLGNMLYYSFPFVIAAFMAFLLSNISPSFERQGPPPIPPCPFTDSAL